MSFESLGFEVGDTVNVQGINGNGTVESIEVIESPDLQCDVVVHVPSSGMHFEFTIYEGETFNPYFVKVV